MQDQKNNMQRKCELPLAIYSGKPALVPVALATLAIPVFIYNIVPHFIFLARTNKLELTLSLILSVLFITLLARYIYHAFKKFRQKEPQLVATNKGITIYNYGFISWADIKEIKLNSNRFLQFFFRRALFPEYIRITLRSNKYLNVYVRHNIYTIEKYYEIIQACLEQRKHNSHQ